MIRFKHNIFDYPGVRVLLRGGKALMLCATVFAAAALSSCRHNDPEPDPEPKEHATSILLYAVASNNLSYDFADDLSELLTGASQLDPEQSDIWIYSLTPKEEPTLRHVVRGADGAPTLEVVKHYDRQTFSTDPKRISGVIEDYLAATRATRRGLIMWSHATGWQPNFSDHVVPEPKTQNAPAVSGKVDLPANHSYGADQYNGVTDYCDLLELDEAIPADTFDFIWFDCCYMSAIEVLYQLRDKTPYIVAYPTEVAAAGMPYDLTIPYMASADYDLVKAAKAMAKYYLDQSQVVTIAITDTSKLPELAVAAEKAVGGTRLPILNLQKYSRNPNGPFVDFGQYTRTWGANGAPDWDAIRFEAALDAAVIYKRASQYGFDRRPILQENFSGISTHYYEDFGTDASEYYQQLDWFKAVYPRYTESAD